MVSRRTDACQYGSRAEFAIIVGRHANPIETSSPAAVVMVLWQAKQRFDNWNSSFGVRSTAATGHPTIGEVSNNNVATPVARNQKLIVFRIGAFLLPALLQAAVKEIPEQIKDNLSASP